MMGRITTRSLPTTMDSCQVRSTSHRKSWMDWLESERDRFLGIRLHQEDKHQPQDQQQVSLRSQEERSRRRTWRKWRRLGQSVGFRRPTSAILGMKCNRCNPVQLHSIAKSRWPSSKKRVWRKLPPSLSTSEGKAHPTSRSTSKNQALTRRTRSMTSWWVRFRHQISIGLKGRRSWMLWHSERRIEKN